MPVTVRQAIGHLAAGPREDSEHRPELIEAWRRCPPGRSLRKVVPNVSSFQSVRLDPDRPSTTQTSAHFNWHYEHARYLKISGLALIGSFPRAFTWPCSRETAKIQIGNSVPPLFMRAIARHIRFVMLPAPRREDAAA